jgi:hypothetical protein
LQRLIDAKDQDTGKQLADMEIAAELIAMLYVFSLVSCAFTN